MWGVEDAGAVMSRPGFCYGAVGSVDAVRRFPQGSGSAMLSVSVTDRIESDSHPVEGVGCRQNIRTIRSPS
jgi:hypothetical protein